MQDNIDHFEPGELMPDYPQLQELALSLLGEQELASTSRDSGNGETAEWFARPTLALDLSELLAGDTGEVVLTSDAQLSLTTTAHVQDAGFVDHHVTADGEDVSGYAFMSFDSGITVYYPTNADLSLDTIVS